MRLEDASRAELLIALRALLDERGAERQYIEELREEVNRLATECAALERQNATLTHLQVAMQLLHRTLDRKQVTSAIQEIVINLIGSEQVALFEVDQRRERLTLTTSFGVDERRLQHVPLGSAPIGQCAVTGTVHVATAEEQTDPGEGRPSVCVPLVMGDRTVGVLVLFRLLPHKTQLEEVDFALFELLRTQAAIALVATHATRYVR